MIQLFRQFHPVICFWALLACFTFVSSGHGAESLSRSKAAEKPIEKVRSVEGRVPAQIIFENRSTVPVSVYWVDYQAKEKFYNELRAGQSLHQATYLTHVWRVRDKRTNVLVMTTVADKKQKVVTISGEPLRTAKRHREVSALTVEEVIRLKQAGVSDQVILELLRSEDYGSEDNVSGEFQESADFAAPEVVDSAMAILPIPKMSEVIIT